MVVEIVNAVPGTVTNIRLVSENDELTLSVSSLAALSETPAVGVREYIDVYQELAAKIAEEAVKADYSGLYELWMYYQEGVASLSQGKTKLEAEAVELLESWPRLIMAYLKEPEALQHGEALVTHLRHPLLSLPVSDEDAAVLMMMLDDSQPLPDKGFGESSPDSETNIFILDDAVDLEDVDEDMVDKAQVFSSYNEVPPLPSRELVTALLSQLTVMQGPLDNIQNIIDSDEATTEDIGNAVEVYAGYLERFGMASMEVGLIGLYEVCRHVVNDIRDWSRSENPSLKNMGNILNKLAVIMRSYLLAPYVEKNCSDLFNCLCDKDWPHPLTPEKWPSIVSRIWAMH